MNGRLERDVFIVFATWFVICYLWSGFPILAAPMVITGVLLIWGVGLAAGVSLTWFVSQGQLLWARRRLAGGLAGAAKDFAVARIMDSDDARTLHEVPLPVVAEPDKGRIRGNPFAKLPWWGAYAKKHPYYANLMMAVLAVMESKPGIPASPKGNHGHLSLIDHSLNVVSSMLELAPAWEYSGLRDKKGQVTQPLNDVANPVHRIADPTALGDPLLPVLAFAHDIGKVDCYELQKGGIVQEIKGGHGEVGAALLRRMEEVQSLPMTERDALLLAVEFYHHLSDMPTAKWIPDRVRSLTALLYVADCDASLGEGDQDAEKSAGITQYRTGASQPAQVAPPASAAPVLATPPEQSPGAPSAPTVAAPSPSASTAAPSGSATGWEADDGRTPLDVFDDLITSPGAINGKNKETRLAFKKDGWLYVFEEALRKRAAAAVPDPSIAEHTGTRRHPFTEELLRQLEEQGRLKLDHDGWLYDYRNALWIAKTSERGPESVVLIVKAEGVPGQHAVPEAGYAPEVVACMWGVKAATGRMQPAAAPAAQQPSEAGDACQNAGESDTGLGEDADLPFDFANTLASKPLLTFAALRRIATADKSAYGLQLRDRDGGGRRAFFDAEKLAADYTYEFDALPANVGHANGQSLIYIEL